MTQFLSSAAIALAGFLACTGLAARAEISPGLVDARLLPGWRTGPDTHMAALQLRMAPGWKTYWRSPGDAGIPPQFDWQGSRNMAGIRAHWPTPRIFEFGGMRTVGYQNELVLPLELRIASPDQPLHLQATIEIGVCKDICVPVTLQLSSDLPDVSRADPAIRTALQSVPGSARAGHVRTASCRLEPGRRGMKLHGRIDMPRLGQDEVVVVESADPRLWVSETSTRREGGHLTLEAEMIAQDRGPFVLDRSGVTFTVIADGRAIEIRGCTGA